MRLVDPLLMEFDREASTTRKMLERIPDEKLGWKPHSRSMSLAQLAWHLATIPGWVAAGVLKDGHDMAAGGLGYSEPPATADAIQEAFATNTLAAKAAMSQLDDVRAMGSWRLSAGPTTIMEMPRLAFLRTILLNHSIHHRGQLTVYFRLLDLPVPAIYGPSADENPFRQA